MKGSDTTALQRDIIHAAASRLDSSPSEIAEIVGCSASYAREVAQDAEDRIKTLSETSHISYLPSFSHPYSMLLHDENLFQYSLEEDDPVLINGEYEGNHRDAIGRVEELPEDWFKQESLARAQGLYFAAEEIESSDTSIFTQMETWDGHANPSTHSECEQFILDTRQHLQQNFKSAQPEAFIGVGILEILHGERDPTNLINSPYFNFEKEYFVKYMARDTPEITEFHKIFQDINTPDEVFFTYYNEKLTDEQQKEFKKKVVNQKYFKSTWNYALPNAPSLVGPTSTEVTDKVIKIDQNSLDLIPGVQEVIEFYNNDQVVEGLTADTLFEAIQNANPQFETLAAERSDIDRPLPIRKDGEQLSFIFDQVTVVADPQDDKLIWSRPSEIQNIQKLTNTINQIIKNQMDFDKVNKVDTVGPNSPRFDKEDWVFDTNVLYHDHLTDQPTSILHTVFQYSFFEGAQVDIPWTVLFELNKHAQKGKKKTRKIRQGFENVKILHLLDHIGYLSINVNAPPEKVPTNIEVGDIADMHFLHRADKNNARLLTGDTTLRELCQMAHIDTMDIFNLQSLSEQTSDEDPEETLLPQIGSELITKEEIYEELADKIAGDTTVTIPETSQLSPNDPQDRIKRWESEGSVVKYYNKEVDEVCYAQRVDLCVVPTESACELIAECISAEDDRLLCESFNRCLKDPSGTLSEDEFPYLEVVVPARYVAKNASQDDSPSEFNEKILSIKQAVNVSYQTRPLTISDNSADVNSKIPTNFGEDSLVSDSGYPALSLAMAIERSQLLVVKDDPIWKFSQLFDVKAMQLKDQLV